VYFFLLGTSIDLAARVVWAALKRMFRRRRLPPVDDGLASEVAREFAAKFLQEQGVPEENKGQAALAMSALLHHVIVEHNYRKAAG